MLPRRVALSGITSPRVPETSTEPQRYSWIHPQDQGCGQNRSARRRVTEVSKPPVCVNHHPSRVSGARETEAASAQARHARAPDASSAIFFLPCSLVVSSFGSSTRSFVSPARHPMPSAWFYAIAAP
uniref:Uncharacterized protein n=1 Tax=Nelumbo nucifera TaxID=4432 RepID=A0A822XTU0_NELNU|nr:TPA_asm: hypothetical protein HUJ06_024885 [Nelumbo nucifera]